MELFFNTAGPNIQEDHYHLKAVDRLADGEIMDLISKKRYFVMHAPRQTGKTSALLGLCEELNAGGDYDAIYINVEGAQGYREEISEALRVIIEAVAGGVDVSWRDSELSSVIEGLAAGANLEKALTTVSKSRQKPVVLFIDEIDALVGDTLITVLRQIRSGYAHRPEYFPNSIVLCGVRDVREYRIKSSRSNEIITGGSCFNIKSVSLRLSNFTDSEVRELLHQHTTETGQVFTEEALELVWHFTEGQPWLVNSLADECCFKREGLRDRSISVTGEHMRAAKERLIRARATHLDQLTDKLKEPRVQRVMEPIVAGLPFDMTVPPDDFEYVVDLGLIVSDDSGFRISNAIYLEVIPRELNWVLEQGFKTSHDRLQFIAPDGTLLMDKLLTQFVIFFRENSEHWVERFSYKEAGPHLILQAFLQRVINGGGRIGREYGLGRMRTDLLITWPTTDDGLFGPCEQFVMELKLLHKGLEETIELGTKQTAEYMQRTGMAESLGHLIVFDRRPEVAWSDKVFTRMVTGPNGERIKVWGC